MNPSAWILIGVFSAIAAIAAPDRSASRNGVIRAGLAISNLIDASNPDSLTSQCTREGHGLKLFSESCKSLLDQLQKKLSLMTLESDIQIQSEKLNRRIGRSKRRRRLETLANLNLASTRAEDLLKSIKANHSEDRLHERLDEMVAEMGKLQKTLLDYSESITNGNL